MLRRERSGFSISPDEELEQKHQGSLGGQVLVERHAREASKRASAISTETAEAGSEVAMTSSSQQRQEKVSSEPEPAKQSSKKHHYKK